MKINEKKYYDKKKNWDFNNFDIISEKLTDWDMYDILNNLSNENSKILDIGTGGGEQLLEHFPCVKEIVGTDYSSEMIKTANHNLLKSKRKNIKFRVMNNLKMDVPMNYYDIIVARNTVIDAKQIYDALMDGGYLIVRGVDKYDCHELKLIFEKGQGVKDSKPISIVDYENILSAGFKDVELVPIHEKEYFKSKENFCNFLLKVPIINDFNEKSYEEKIDQNKLMQYIERNTCKKGIRLIRRYYGIIAKK